MRSLRRLTTFAAMSTCLWASAAPGQVTLRLLPGTSMAVKPKPKPALQQVVLTGSTPQIVTMDTPPLGELYGVPRVAQLVADRLKHGAAAPTDVDARCSLPGAAPRRCSGVYRTLITGDVKAFARYAGAQIPALLADPSPQRRAELLHNYACRALSRAIPGVARIVKVRVGGAAGSLGDWEAALSQDEAREAPLPVAAGAAATPESTPTRQGAREDLVEVCTVTHLQLAESLKKDLRLVAAPSQMAGAKSTAFTPAPEAATLASLTDTVIAAIATRDRKTIDANRACAARTGGTAKTVMVPVPGKLRDLTSQLACTTGVEPRKGAPVLPSCPWPRRLLGGMVVSPRKAPGNYTCAVDWDGECRAAFGASYGLASLSGTTVLCGRPRAEYERRIQNILRHLELGGATGVQSLAGETLNGIVERLLGFYRKRGDARLFAATDHTQGAAIQLPGDAPGPLADAVAEQNAGARTLRGREVLRRFVDQWTDAWEYQQMAAGLRSATPTLRTAPLGNGTRPAPRDALEGAVYAALQQLGRRPSFAADLLGYVQSQARAAFWRSPSELRDICQDPQDAEERAACVRAAITVADQHCVEGRGPNGCLGDAVNGNPRTLGAWLRAQAAELVATGGGDAAGRGRECRPEYSGLLAARHFLGAPDSSAFSNRAMRYLDAVPISQWQKCQLWRQSCDGSLAAENAQAPGDAQAARLGKVIDDARMLPGTRGNGDPRTTNLRFEENLLLRALVWEWVPDDKQGRPYWSGTPSLQLGTGTRQGMCNSAGTLADQARTEWLGGGLAEFLRNYGVETADAQSTDGLGGVIADALMPIVGKILGSLLQAAGISEMMKTLARAAGLTPEQSADCEDPEYRQNQLKIPKGSALDSKRGCLTRVFARNFVDALESVILMLGGKVVDWGIDLLRAALQGVKSALLSAAGSVPFAGGFLAVLVDVGWEVIMNFGAKALLKGLVVAKLPEWLRIRELGTLPVERFGENPVLASVMGIVLETIEAAVQYGNKGWLEVGFSSVLEALQAVFARADQTQSGVGNYWTRAFLYAKKELQKAAAELAGADTTTQLRRLVAGLVNGFGDGLARFIPTDSNLQALFKTGVAELVAVLNKKDGQLHFSLDTFKGDPLTQLNALLGKAENLAPVLVPALLGILPMPDGLRAPVARFAGALADAAKQGKNADPAAAKGAIKALAGLLFDRMPLAEAGRATLKTDFAQLVDASPKAPPPVLGTLVRAALEKTLEASLAAAEQKALGGLVKAAVDFGLGAGTPLATTVRSALGDFVGARLLAPAARRGLGGLAQLVNDVITGSTATDVSAVVAQVKALALPGVSLPNADATSLAAALPSILGSTDFLTAACGAATGTCAELTNALILVAADCLRGSDPGLQAKLSTWIKGLVSAAVPSDSLTGSLKTALNGLAGLLAGGSTVAPSGGAFWADAVTWLKARLTKELQTWDGLAQTLLGAMADPLLDWLRNPAQLVTDRLTASGLLRSVANSVLGELTKSYPSGLIKGLLGVGTAVFLQKLN